MDNLLDWISLEITIIGLAIGGAIFLWKLMNAIEAIRAAGEESRKQAQGEHESLMNRMRDDNKQEWDRHNKLMEKIDKSIETNARDHLEFSKILSRLDDRIKKSQ